MLQIQILICPLGAEKQRDKSGTSGTSGTDYGIRYQLEQSRMYSMDTMYTKDTMYTRDIRTERPNAANADSYTVSPNSGPLLDAAKWCKYTIKSVQIGVILRQKDRPETCVSERPLTPLFVPV